MSEQVINPTIDDDDQELASIEMQVSVFKKQLIEVEASLAAIKKRKKDREDKQKATAIWESSCYHKFRQSHRDSTTRFKWKNSDALDFNKHLKQGEVAYFEITQDANIVGEYARCFYSLKSAKDKYLQVVPLKVPYVRFRGEGLVMSALPEDHELWHNIELNFKCVQIPYQVQYTAIEEEKEKEKEKEKEANKE